MEQDNTSPTPQEDQHEMYVDEKTREKVRKHWSDENDKITDEDIKNVNTDIYARPNTEDENEELDKITEALEHKEAPNPWEVQSE